MKNRDIFMSIKEKQPRKPFRIADLSFEERQRFVGFFELLLKVDKRVNPELYKSRKEKND